MFEVTDMVYIDRQEYVPLINYTEIYSLCSCRYLLEHNFRGHSMPELYKPFEVMFIGKLPNCFSQRGREVVFLRQYKLIYISYLKNTEGIYIIRKRPPWDWREQYRNNKEIELNRITRFFDK